MMNLHAKYTLLEGNNTMTEEIGMRKPTKFSIHQWRLRWDLLLSFKMLRQSGMQETPQGVHWSLFFNQTYCRKILIDVFVVTGHALWRQLNSPILGLGMNIRSGNLMGGIHSFRKKSNCQRLLRTWDPSHGTPGKKERGG